ncbi:MAG: glycolate oxidase subunit GlcF [Burkholderiales bacterium]|nr:glycolate oxidase subunit GlcF [Burkholderiales bacterium]
MQTNLAEWIKDTPEGIEADAILRKCVHCGFCLATCPTYQLTGDELDSPRGRIYLMKEMLEGNDVTAKTQHHLDRCLTCRACETTCPSGVQYGRLVDIGREVIEKKVPRGLGDQLKRSLLKNTLPHTALFSIGLGIGRAVKGLLPDGIGKYVTSRRDEGVWPQPVHARKMLVLAGCVQPAMAPSINCATARVLDKLGISLIGADKAGCCGAIAHHLNDAHDAHAYVKRNIDAWWPAIERGAEAIVVTASGCGTMVAEYGHLLRNDPVYAVKAARVSALYRDVSQVIAQERTQLSAVLKSKADIYPVDAEVTRQKVAFQSPCSLQHGLKIRGVVEGLLRDAGFDLTMVPDGHLCCGSAGTYSLLQPEMSAQLLANKVNALESGSPDIIATANIGCMAHIESGLNASSRTPILHWVELLDRRLA